MYTYQIPTYFPLWPGEEEKKQGEKSCTSHTYKAHTHDQNGISKPAQVMTFKNNSYYIQVPVSAEGQKVWRGHMIENVFVLFYVQVNKYEGYKFQVPEVLLCAVVSLSSSRTHYSVYAFDHYLVHSLFGLEPGRLVFITKKEVQNPKIGLRLYLFKSDSSVNKDQNEIGDLEGSYKQF